MWSHVLHACTRCESVYFLRSIRVHRDERNLILRTFYLIQKYSPRRKNIMYIKSELHNVIHVAIKDEIDRVFGWK